MSQLQIFISPDDLAEYKLNRHEQYGCLFFEHDINKTMDIGQGVYNNTIYQEGIITDGNINLNRKNFNMPFIIYKNQLFKMEDGLSIPITLRNASFYILKTKVQKDSNIDTEYSIHCNNESKELLDKLIKYIYNQEYDLFQTESITLYDKNTISMWSTNKNGISKHEIIDLSPNEYKSKKKRKKK